MTINSAAVCLKNNMIGSEASIRILDFLLHVTHSGMMLEEDDGNNSNTKINAMMRRSYRCHKKAHDNSRRQDVLVQTCHWNDRNTKASWQQMSTTCCCTNG